MAGGDDLEHGRHPDRVRAETLQHAQLGAGLVGRPREHDVDPLVEADAGPFGGGAGPSRQLGVVRVGQGREPRAEDVDVGTEQRVVARQVEVVGDEHQLAGLESRDSARRPRS